MCDILEMFSYHRFENQQQPYYPTKRVHNDFTRGSPDFQSSYDKEQFNN